VPDTVQACEAAMMRNSAPERQARSEATWVHAWSARLDQIGRIIDRTLSPESSAALQQSQGRDASMPEPEPIASGVG
jgi:hypothetical protein